MPERYVRIQNDARSFAATIAPRTLKAVLKRRKNFRWDRPADRAQSSRGKLDLLDPQSHIPGVGDIPASGDGPRRFRATRRRRPRERGCRRLADSRSSSRSSSQSDTPVEPRKCRRLVQFPSAALIAIDILRRRWAPHRLSRGPSLGGHVSRSEGGHVFRSEKMGVVSFRGRTGSWPVDQWFSYSQNNRTSQRGDEDREGPARGRYEGAETNLVTGSQSAFRSASPDAALTDA